MISTTPAQEILDSRARIHNAHASIVPAKATSCISRGPVHTSTSNGCAVQYATGSF